MSDRDRVAQAICRADNRYQANPAVLDNYEDDAEYYLVLADAAIEAMNLPALMEWAYKQGDGRTDEDLKPGADVELLAEARAAQPESTKRGTRLPEAWQPSEGVQRELWEKYPGVNLGLILEEFRDYWCAVPGSKGLKLSWDRTFRNRVREVAHKPQYRRQGFGMRAGDQPMSKVDLKAASYLEEM